MHGKFIVIEGGDGAGKDTQIALLKKDFSGPSFVYTRETGGTPLGQYIRQALFHEAAGTVSIPAEFFLVLADRAQHVEEVVRPSLESGKNVISNRSWLSTYAYQLYGREYLTLTPLMKECLEFVYTGCPLDLAIVLDIPAEVGMQRQKVAGKVLDIMERMPLSLHERVRQGFLEVAKTLPQANVIDANRSVEAVYADVKKAVEDILRS
jgi:dTMP kinase